MTFAEAFRALFPRFRQPRAPDAAVPDDEREARRTLTRDQELTHISKSGG